MANLLLISHSNFFNEIFAFSNWKFDGLTIINYTSEQVTTKCGHLTSFALLMQVNRFKVINYDVYIYIYILIKRFIYIYIDRERKRERVHIK